jgi:hypothetical protein
LPWIRRFHVARAIISGATAASLIAVLVFGGLYLMRPKPPEPLAAPVAKPAPLKKGPTIVRDNSAEVPVVEAHEVFSIH